MIADTFDGGLGGYGDGASCELGAGEGEAPERSDVDKSEPCDAGDCVVVRLLVLGERKQLLVTVPEAVVTVKTLEIILSIKLTKWCGLFGLISAAVVITSLFSGVTDVAGGKVGGGALSTTVVSGACSRMTLLRIKESK